MNGTELAIEIAPLLKRKLFIAVPSYASSEHSLFRNSLLHLQMLLLQARIPHRIFTLSDSLITRARNMMTAKFLETANTDILFLDADIEFVPADVFALLHFDKEMIGAAYPLKSVDWALIKKAVLMNPDIDPAELSKAGATWAAHLFSGQTVIGGFNPVSIDELATGFMLCKREVFERLAPSCLTYASAVNDGDMPSRITDFFTVGVDEKRDRYESEDYALCRKWKEIGGTVWLCPWISLTHHGNYAYKGDILRTAQLLGLAKELEEPALT